MSDSSKNLTTEQKLDKVLVLAVNASEDLKDIKTRLAKVETTQAKHTTQLDGIAKDVKTLLDEKAITTARFDRLEKWALQVGEKIGIKLEV